MINVRFCGNVDDPTVLILFSDPDQAGPFWTSTNEVQFYAGQVIPDFDWHPRGFRSSVRYLELIKVRAFAYLRERGIRLVVEGGSLKDNDPDGRVGREQLQQLYDAVEAAGGHLDAVTMDEPFTAAVHHIQPPMDLDRAADIVAEYIRTARILGVDIYWIEAFPALRTSGLTDALARLAAREALPSRFVWDIDPYDPHADAALIDQPRVREGMRRLATRMAAQGLAQDVILTASRIRSQVDYAVVLARNSENYRRLFGCLVTGIVVQSWQVLMGEDEQTTPRWVPRCLPLDDPTSHLALLSLEAARWKGD